MTVFCRGHPLAALRPELSRRGFVPAAGLKRLSSGQTVKIIGMKVLVHAPPTRSGRRVMFVTLEDETGLADAAVFPETQAASASGILTSEVAALEGTLKKDGPDGRSLSIAARRFIPDWSGRLTDLLQKVFDLESLS